MALHNPNYSNTQNYYSSKIFNSTNTSIHFVFSYKFTELCPYDP